MRGKAGGYRGSKGIEKGSEIYKGINAFVMPIEEITSIVYCYNGL